MPINPLGAGRSSPSSGEDVRISVGSIVEYDQHGAGILAVAVQEKKGKWSLINESGGTVELAPDRLTLIPGRIDATDAKSVSAELKQFLARATALIEKVELDSLWELLRDETREIQTKEFTELAFGKLTGETFVATRRALTGDQPFFKRRKSGFEARPANVVEEMQQQFAAEAERKRAREVLAEAILKGIKKEKVEFPGEIRDLAFLAALGSSAERAKETTTFLEEIVERSRLPIQGRNEDKAFELLVACGYFSPDEDLELLAQRIPREFTPAALEAAVSADWSREGKSQFSGYTVTIDSETTKDIDDALSLEEREGGFRLGIHISDVAAVIPPETVLDYVGKDRATSIYCPDYLIPMLPPELSEKSLSLVEGEERPVVSYYLELDREYRAVGRSIKREYIRVSRRLTYNQLDPLLYGERAVVELLPWQRPYDSEEGAKLTQLIQRLWEVSCALERSRLERGSVQFTRRELNAVVSAEGKVSLEPVEDDLPSRKLVGEMMIAANETAALIASENKIPLIFRSQEAPDIDIPKAAMAIPEGPAREYAMRGMMKRSVTSTNAGAHYGLGVRAYTQLTSPIRRYVDLLNERQIVAWLESGKAHYSAEEIQLLQQQVESALDQVNFVQRTRNRYWIQRYLQQQGITEVEATVVRVDGVRPLAELDGLCTLTQFYAKKGITLSPAERIRLRVETNVPRRGIWQLQQIV